MQVGTRSCSDERTHMRQRTDDNALLSHTHREACMTTSDHLRNLNVGQGGTLVHDGELAASSLAGIMVRGGDARLGVAGAHRAVIP